jgi:hypothetical protein
MKSTKGDVFTIIAITSMWVCAIPLEVLLFTTFVKWPLDLTLLILMPFVLIWMPASYPLAIAGNRCHQKGEGFGLSSDTLIRFAVLGVLTSVLSAVTVFLYGLLGSGAAIASAFVALLGCVCVWGSVHVVRKILKEAAGSVSV